ncbi:MAG TPA: hypothetical protein PKO36_06445 [Candidatus Hydrogenedentes bacterium]|nr:hypothetical protein [Candidatus Hydrogenedentota bacterium]HOV74471.1 hypothetical protein [Candidatus Hydrogenedentota bacterium]
MRATVRRLACVGLCAAAVIAAAPAAEAFFPLGGYNAYLQLRLARWSWPAFNDANNDGDLIGNNEGLEIFIAGGATGFTDDEQAIVRQAFDVWQKVPTSYVHFMFKGPIADPIPLGAGSVNFMNTVSIQAGLPFLGAGIGLPSATAITYVVDDGVVPPALGTYGYWYSGEIVEADIVVDSTQVRVVTPGVKPLFDLQACVAHEVGVMLGLMATPLNNLEATSLAGQTVLLESPVVALRDATNTLRLAGATPTMFPLPFYVELGQGQYINGNGDLAPDDIAGVSFLYPRGNQDAFFTISHEARTQTRANYPSVPLRGAHIVAWCDVDNDPNTSRVPLFSTMTGLYEIQPMLGGRFDLYGMSKTLETIGGKAFVPTYTLTMSPLNAGTLERQSIPGGSSTLFASIIGAIAQTPMTAPWDQFQSEVFHDGENIFDIAKHDLGTPLHFDRVRNQVVSSDTGKILATMLPGQKPMFGDRNDVCPLNLIPTVTATTTTNTTLRALRDGFLMKTAAGSMLVDVYYQVAPAMARYLLGHAAALGAWRAVLQGVEWLLGHAAWAAGGLTALVLLAWGWRRRRKAAAVTAILFLAACLAMPAHATVAYLTDEEMVGLSDAIVTGKVTSVESKWIGNGIVTDVIILIENVVKGPVNKNGDLYLRLAGGRVGSVVTKVSELPEFAKDQEVVLYLQEKPGEGYVVVAGSRGKFDVLVTATGNKYVTASTPEARAAMTDTLRKQADGNNQKLFRENDPRIPLDAYLDYLGDIVKSQKSGK